MVLPRQSEPTAAAAAAADAADEAAAAVRRLIGESICWSDRVN